MDRMISLLAALVGLIALGGAVLVHTHADTQQQQMATEIAGLKAALGGAPAASEEASQQAANDGTAEALLALQDRIVALEQLTREQASQLAEASERLAASPAASSTEVAALVPEDETATADAGGEATPAAVRSDGPTSDCIPIGTRFMAQTGDSFPICRTRQVVKITGLSDGLVSISGAGEVPEGGTGKLSEGCNVAVFSADTSIGFAEMRVSCT